MNTFTMIILGVATIVYTLVAIHIYRVTRGQARKSR